MLDLERPEWQAGAACRGVGPNVFYIAKGGSTGPARKYCTGCPVANDCLDYALERGITDGIWGGLTPLERRRVRRRRLNLTAAQRAPQQPRPPAACGTEAGYMRHRRRGEPACDDCRHGHAADTAARRQAS